MAAEPSGATTMSDLILRVAEKLGIAEYRSTGQLHIPVDQYNFNLCKRYVNNGIRMFMADAPRKGWRWMRRLMTVTFTTRVTGIIDSIPGANQILDASLMTTYTAATDLVGWYIYITTGTGIGSYAAITVYDEATGTITVADWLDANGDAGGIDPIAGSKFAITSIETNNGDTSRYTLPADFGGTVDGKIKYAANSNRGTAIEWCDESTVRARRAVSVNSGTPLLAAIRPYEPTSEALSATRRWEMIVDPMPYVADVVEFPYTLHFDSMKMESGIATAGNDTTLTDNLRTEETVDYFKDWIITIIDGVNVGKSRTITGYDGAGKFTFATMTVNNTITSQYIVTPAANLHPAGHQFDDAIEAACLARCEAESQDEHFDDYWQTYYHKKAIPNAFKVDMRSAPRTLGPMLNGPALPRGRSFNNVTY